MEEFKNKVVDIFVTYGGKLLLALVALVVGMFIIKNVKKLMTRKEQESSLDATLAVILRNVVNLVLYGILIFTIVEILGVPMTSVMALIASCGLAIGLSLQGALSNFAGGLIIILFKPFKVGDYIESNSSQGTVKDINMFYTVLVTLDNNRISIPNGELMNSSIVNYSIEKTRRIDLDFKITNDCDADFAGKVLLEAASSTKGILLDPPPFARLAAVDDDTYIFTVRGWVESNDYWDRYFDVLENCSKALTENGIDDPEERMAVRIVKSDD